MWIPKRFPGKLNNLYSVKMIKTKNWDKVGSATLCYTPNCVQAEGAGVGGRDTLDYTGFLHLFKHF